MTDKLVFEADSSQAVKSMGELRLAASEVKKAFAELSAASPRAFQTQMAQTATAIAGLTASIVSEVDKLHKSYDAMAKGITASAKKGGADAAKALNNELQAGAEKTKSIVAQQKQWLQAAYEQDLGKGVVFSPRDISDLRAWGVSVGADVKASLHDGMLRARSATRMSEDDVRGLLGMPSRDEMKTFSASLRSQMQDSLRTEGLRARSAGRLNEDDTRALLGMPDRGQMKSFAASLKSQMQTDLQTAGMRARGASRMNEDDTRALLGMPTRDEMKSFAGSLRAQMQEALKTDGLRAKSASKFTEEDTRSLLGMPSRQEMSSFASALKAQMQEQEQVKKKAEEVAKAGDSVSRSMGLQGEQARNLHSAYRGLASGFGALWLTWGAALPLLTGAAISHGVRSVVQMGASVDNTMQSTLR